VGDRFDWDGPSVRLERHRRGWSQPDLAQKLQEASGDEGQGLPEREKLVSTISSWENERARPGDKYQRLLVGAIGVRRRPALESEEYRQLLVVPEVDTGSDEATLRIRFQKATSLTAEEKAQLIQATGELRSLDRRGNDPDTVASMHAHVETLHVLLTDTFNPADRLVLARTLGDAEAIAGWSALDRGRPRESLTHLTSAVAVAAFGEDRSLQVFASAQRAFVLIDLGEYQQAEDLVRELLALHRRSLPSGLIAWLFGALAEAAAMNRNGALCKDALDRGRKMLERGEPGDEHPYVVLNEGHFTRWEGSCLAKLGDPEAVDLLDHVRRDIPPSFDRALGGVLVDLLQAYIAQDELEAARAVFEVATATAGTVGSVRQLNRLRALRTELVARIDTRVPAV